MKGVQFLVDDQGERKAVLIDLDLHGELWEDFYDAALAKRRQHEPRESLEEVGPAVLEDRRAFGMWRKRAIDGVDYQRTLREEWP